MSGNVLTSADDTKKNGKNSKKPQKAEQEEEEDLALLMQQAELNKNKNKSIKAKSIPQILQEMDPSAPKEDVDKFIRMIDDILKSCKIEDSKEDIVVTLRKIESSLHYMIEARNYLYLKDEEMIKRFEQDVEKERKDRKFKEKQLEQAQKDAESKQK